MAYLAVDQVSKTYGAVAALRSFSLVIERGETMALVGPDGAGKSTLIRILCRLVKRDGGTVSIEGTDLFSDFTAFKQRLGYMPQNFSLYPDLSVAENLTFYAGLFGVTGEALRTKRKRLYAFSQLAPFAERRAGALSGGMKQKLALMCALVHDPELLILDEPTTGVDPLSRRQFWEILAELKRSGVTILVSTPYMDEVARADRACFLLGGRQLSVGTPTELAGQFEGQLFHLQREPAASLVEALNRIEQFRARRFGSGLHCYLPAAAKPEQFGAELRGLGIEPSEMTKIEPELEDRFIQLMEQPV